MSRSNASQAESVGRGQLKKARALSITYRPISELVLNPKNPRIHSPKQVRQLARCIDKFGFNVPVLVDAHGQLIAGHGRVLAAQLLGMSRVPTITIEHLSETQVHAFLIADNRLTENSDWDEQLLGEQLRDLSVLDLDFSLDITGFEVSEIDTFVENAQPAVPSKDNHADSISEFRTTPKVTHPGDLWAMGRHRVYCGDARGRSSYAMLMARRRAAAVFTDPPFNDRIDGYVAGFGKTHHREFPVASGEMTEAEFNEFLSKILLRLAMHCVDGALLYVCIDWRHLFELISASRSLRLQLKNLCVWVKENAGQGSLYRSQHELILVLKKGTKPHRNNIKLGQFGRYRTNVWHYKRVNSLARNTDDETLSGLHPTVKPADLVADAILDCTARSDIILDPFLGSGTTVIAAERTGRVCYGLELDTRYVYVAVRRWQSFTGGIAVQESTGRTFNEIEEENHERTVES